VLWVLMGTIGIVWLIACANVANLLLVRTEGRHHELAVCAALGAGGGRIARELLLESLVLGLIAGTLGAGLAWGAVRVLVAVGPPTLPRLSEITIDSTVLSFTLLVSVLSGLLFGLIPVAKYAGPHIAVALRGSGPASSHSRERLRVRDTLVVVQVALALVLLVGSGLMIRTFQALRAVHPGFTTPEQIQLVRLTIPSAQVADPERVVRTQSGMVQRIAAVSGVATVSFSSGAPMEPFNDNDIVLAADQPYAEGQIPPIRRFKFVSPGFFQTVGTPLVAGRDLTWSDVYDRRPVALISENLARELWREPAVAIGQRIRENPTNPWREVVGVVGDVFDNGVQERAPTMVYWPVLMENFWRDRTRVQRSVTFAIRSSRTGTDSFIKAIREAMWAVNADVPLIHVRTLGDVYEGSLARTSFTLVMLAIAAIMALTLGVVGVYAVISYAVSQRTREIGIRQVLGAQRAELTRMFIGHALTLSGIGVACGVTAAAALSRFITSLLFGTNAVDPGTYVAVSFVLMAAAALASYLPAHRATTRAPVQALRAE
jgi:putative ABC transport system permease protein